MCEIVARTLKNKLRNELRDLVKQVCIPAQGPFIRHVVNFLGNIFFTYRKTYWCKTIKPYIQDKFVSALKETELNRQYDLSTNLDLMSVLKLFQSKHTLFCGWA